LFISLEGVIFHDAQEPPSLATNTTSGIHHEFNMSGRGILYFQYPEFINIPCLSRSRMIFCARRGYAWNTTVQWSNFLYGSDSWNLARICYDIGSSKEEFQAENSEAGNDDHLNDLEESTTVRR
jgi:hypothetical protein